MSLLAHFLKRILCCSQEDEAKGISQEADSVFAFVMVCCEGN
jgi:hypothetical protein